MVVAAEDDFFHCVDDFYTAFDFDGRYPPIFSRILLEKVGVPTISLEIKFGFEFSRKFY